jgi:hypothetical protein
VLEKERLWPISPRRSNALVPKIQRIYRTSKKTQGGQRALCRLLSDDEPVVRLSAATRCLEWAPDEAQSVLEELRERTDRFGFEAHMVLTQWENGTLFLDLA